MQDTVQRRHELLDSPQLSNAAAAAALSLGHPDKALEWLTDSLMHCLVDDLRAYSLALANHFSAIDWIRKCTPTTGITHSQLKDDTLSIDDRISLKQQESISILRRNGTIYSSISRALRIFFDLRNVQMCGVPDEGIIVITNVHDDHLGPQ